MTTTQGSKNNKWIWIGLGAAALFCLCAVGVAAFLLMRLGQQVKEGMKTDPEEASAAAHAIADYELPEGYEEVIAMDFFVYKMVMIGPGDSDSSSEVKPMILLAQFQSITNEQQMREQMRRSMEQQSGVRGMSMEIVEVKKMTIRGEDVDVVIYEGTNNRGYVIRELITTFPGKDGTAMLMIMGSAGYWDDDEVDAFVESIH